jgi:hypothetical protein
MMRYDMAVGHEDGYVRQRVTLGREEGEDEAFDVFRGVEMWRWIIYCWWWLGKKGKTRNDDEIVT